MAEFGHFEDKLKAVTEKAKALGVSLMSSSGHIEKPDWQRRRESGRSAARIQAELAKEMQSGGTNSLKTQRIFKLTQELTARREDEEKHNPAKMKGQVDELAREVSEIEKQFLAELEKIGAAALQARRLEEEEEKLKKEEQSLQNQRQDLRSRGQHIQTLSDVQRLEGDVQQLQGAERVFLTEQEREEAKIKQFTDATKNLMPATPEIVDRIKQTIHALKESFKKAKE